jgi:hypothetical protein
MKHGLEVNDEDSHDCVTILVSQYVSYLTQYNIIVLTYWHIYLRVRVCSVEQALSLQFALSRTLQRTISNMYCQCL